MNFGTSGTFGTIQQSLLYETLIESFDHDYVIIGMLPDNDFKDDDFEYGKSVHFRRYRPYYSGKYPDYETVFYKNDISLSAYQPTTNTSQLDKNIIKNFTYTGNLLVYVKSLYFHKSALKKQHTKSYSGYYDYTNEELLRVRYSYEKIVKIANRKNREIIVI